MDDHSAGDRDDEQDNPDYQKHATGLPGGASAKHLRRVAGWRAVPARGPRALDAGTYDVA